MSLSWLQSSYGAQQFEEGRSALLRQRGLRERERGREGEREREERGERKRKGVRECECVCWREKQTDCGVNGGKPTEAV